MTCYREEVAEWSSEQLRAERSESRIYHATSSPLSLLNIHCFCTGQYHLTGPENVGIYRRRSISPKVAARRCALIALCTTPPRQTGITEHASHESCRCAGSHLERWKAIGGMEHLLKGFETKDDVSKVLGAHTFCQKRMCHALGSPPHVALPTQHESRERGRELRFASQRSLWVPPQWSYGGCMAVFGFMCRVMCNRCSCRI